MLFGHLNVTALFQSLVSGVILAPIDMTFLWLEYHRIIAKSDDPNVTVIHVSLNILACFVSLMSAELSP